jgi:hypothetical protein
MSLALAELLFKNSGDNSLDKARSEHRHHGLVMSADTIPREASLDVAAKALRAVPMSVGGTRRGTFHLWHQSSREPPLAGERRTWSQGAISPIVSFDAILSAIDEPYPQMPGEGLTLLDIISGIPQMLESVSSAGCTSHFIRGSLTEEIRLGPAWSANIRVLFHPGSKVLQFCEGIKVLPADVPRITVHEISHGMQVDIVSDWVNGIAQMPMPPAVMMDTNEWRMWTNTPSLNEFGHLYSGLFIAGNYARYFPDRWLLDIERATPLALSIEELCAVAEWRAPWLTLCELSQTLFVNEA